MGRTMRAAEMNMKKTHLPIEEQNYDPMIPYMAPYMEEAKFQLQEEQELLMYHPYDRRLWTGGVSGMGETMPYGGVTTWKVCERRERVTLPCLSSDAWQQAGIVQLLAERCTG